jgi:signal transduction histidine kinase
MWLGGQDGLFRYQDGRMRKYTTADGLATDFTTVLAEDQQGNLWIGGMGGLTRYDGEHFKAYTVREGLPSPAVRALYFDSQHVLWIGTYDGGLGRYEGTRFVKITKKDGLFSNGVFQILDDKHGYFWMSSNQGIYRVRKQDLNDFAAGRVASIQSIAYAQKDGMLTEECNGGHWPAGIRARDGKLWFPTANGVAIVDPDRVPVNTEPPNVDIESLLADFTPVPLASTVRLNPTQRNFQIEYTALNLMAPEHIRFRYKLEGLDKDWVSAGARRTAYYSHVPHGDYMFRVIAANRDGVWNLQGSSIQIEVAPYFYETWWFLAVVWLATAAALYVGWRRHTNRLTEAFAGQQAFTHQLIASQESERQRIAAELHDSIGQRLAIIKNLALMFSGNGHGPAASAAQLEDIVTESSQAMQEIRHIAYNLRPYQLDELGLAKAIEAMLKRASQASSVAFSSSLDHLDGLFPAESEISFYRIVQEAVNNILKHSSATHADVTALAEEGKLALRIRDNGKGFARPFKMGDPFPEGFGLRGISERAEILGGHILIETSPGGGTTVAIEFDLRRQRKSAGRPA